MTRNSLVAACNQKSNRAPEMMLMEADVEHAMESLRYTHHLVAQVTQAGSRVMKFKHELLSRYPFNAEEAAVLCELILRGPQTAGELRTHTKRMVDIDSTVAVKAVLDSLMHWGESVFVVRLPPHAGMREERYAHVFCGEPQIPEQGTAAGRPEPAMVPGDRIMELEAKVAALDARLAVLEQALL